MANSVINTEYKRRVEDCIKRAVELAIQEKKRVGAFFTEESLRYLVMFELSSKRHYENDFPTYPSLKSTSRPVLLFEFPYDRWYNVNKRMKNKLKQKSGNAIYKPDIVCLKLNSKGEITESLYIIELKVKTNKSDIQKCAEYVHPDIGGQSFHFAICIDFKSANRWKEEPGEPPSNSDLICHLSTRSKGNILWVSTDDDFHVKSQWFLF